LQTFALVETSESSSTPLRFVSSPNFTVIPPAGHAEPGLSGTTFTAAFRPLMLVSVHVEVEPLQT
jgi:hypothetical protein